MPLIVISKMIPFWLSTFLIRWGIVHWISPVFRLLNTSQNKIIEKLTTNMDLRAIFSYLFYGEERVVSLLGGCFSSWSLAFHSTTIHLCLVSHPFSRKVTPPYTIGAPSFPIEGLRVNL